TFTNALYLCYQGSLSASTNLTWNGNQFVARGSDIILDNNRELRSYLSNGVTGYTLIKASTSNTTIIGTSSVTNVLAETTMLAAGKGLVLASGDAQAQIDGK